MVLQLRWAHYSKSCWAKSEGAGYILNNCPLRSDCILFIGWSLHRAIIKYFQIMALLRIACPLGQASKNVSPTVPPLKISHLMQPQAISKILFEMTITNIVCFDQPIQKDNNLSHDHRSYQGEGSTCDITSELCKLSQVIIKSHRSSHVSKCLSLITGLVENSAVTSCLWVSSHKSSLEACGQIHNTSRQAPKLSCQRPIKISWLA